MPSHQNSARRELTATQTHRPISGPDLLSHKTHHIVIFAAAGVAVGVAIAIAAAASAIRLRGTHQTKEQSSAPRE